MDIGLPNEAFKDLYLSGSIRGDKYDIYTEGGGSLYQTDGYVRFATGNTETARIDASGNLLVGTTSNSYSAKVSIEGTNNFPLALDTTANACYLPLYNATTTSSRITGLGPL